MLLKFRKRGPRWTALLPDYAASLAWSPDSERLAAATLAGPVVVLDGARGASVIRHRGHDQGALAVAWSPDGRLASGGQDGRVTVGDESFDSGGAWVEHLAWNGPLLASAAGRVVRVWNGALISEVAGYPSSITSLFWMGNQLVTSCYGGLQFIEMGKADWVRQLDWKGSILTARPSPDGRFIATGNQDASVHVWETASGKDLQMTGYPLKVRELAWHADGPLLATGGGGTITIWSFAGKGPAGKAPVELPGHEERITGLAFAGEQLVSCSDDRTLRIWRHDKKWDCVRVEKSDVALGGLAVSPDGNRVAAAGKGGFLAVWDLDDASHSSS